MSLGSPLGEIHTTASLAVRAFHWEFIRHVRDRSRRTPHLTDINLRSTEGADGIVLQSRRLEAVSTEDMFTLGGDDWIDEGIVADGTEEVLIDRG